MNDHELGMVAGKLEGLQRIVEGGFKAQQENFGEVFKKLEDHQNRIIIVEERQNTMSKWLKIIPVLVTIILGLLAFFLK